MINSLKSLASNELQWGEEISLPSTRILQSTPHVIGGKYPCRSVAYIPRMIFQEYSDANPSKTFTAFDPFMGSGTTAIEANKFTSKIYGLEIDPYARLIANVSNLKYSKVELSTIESTVNLIIKKWNSFRPKKSLDPTLKNIHYWFNELEYSDLLRLKTAIFELSDGNFKMKDFLLVTFAEIIRGCSKAERQSLKPYISTRFPKEPQRVLPSFKKAVKKYISSVSNSAKNMSNGIIWLKGDATNFTIHKPLDIAVTSPPYINALDYTRCIKLESSWIGLMDDASLVLSRNGQVGEASRTNFIETTKTISRITDAYLRKIRTIDLRRFQTVRTYFQDISSNLRCVYKALSHGGEYHIIIGNSTIRGTYIPTHQIIAEIAEDLGFSWNSYFKYPIKDHRTSIPRNGKGGKIAYEHVIKLVKK